MAFRPCTALAWFALLAAFLVARPVQAASEAEAAVARARAMHLAETGAWLRLGHYRAGLLGAVSSDVEGDRFFLSPRGKTDPGAELEATLVALHTPLDPAHADAHALCRFPARRAWLEERLHLGLPTPACPALARFESRLDAQSVAVVFASSYLENPASAFGHLFLRVRARRSAGARPEAAARSDTAVDYAADAKTHNPVLYAAAGLTGGFDGFFGLSPYDGVARKYLDGEERDLWEYDLALTDGETRVLVFHLWELESNAIPYFYLAGNCAYQILAALEAAAPRLDLLDRLNAVVLPADAVKELAAIPGLVRAVHYLPSARREASARDEGHLLTPPLRKAPDLGHASMRVTFGGGGATELGNTFGTIGFRLALHDLLDPPDGEPELSQLQFMDVHFRYDLAQHPPSLDSLTFAEVLALNPLTSSTRALSWRARAFGMRLHDRGCLDCFAHGLDGGVGATLASEDERVAVFLLADAYVVFSPSLDGIGGSFVRAGVGPWGGVRLKLPLRTVALVTGSYSYLPAQGTMTTYDLRAGLRTSIARDAALGVEGAAQPRSVEAQMSTYFYF